MGTIAAIGVGIAVGAIVEAVENHHDSSPPPLAAAPHVPGRMTALLTQSCGAQAGNSQQAVCQVVANHCSNLTFNCSNTAKASVSCDVGTAAQMAAVALKAEPQPVQAQLAQQSATIVQDVMQNIMSNCADETSSSQTLKAIVTCTNSDAAVLNAMNAMDSTSACATAIVTSAIAQARQAVGDTNVPPAPPISNQTALGIALGVTMVLLILLLVAGAISRGRRASPAPPVPPSQ